MSKFDIRESLIYLPAADTFGKNITMDQNKSL
jgi:hypothetical protein